MTPIKNLWILYATGLMACGTTPSHTVPAIPHHQPIPALSPADRGSTFVVGWFCPDVAGARPAIRPLFARTPSWTNDISTLTRFIGSLSVKQFTVPTWHPSILDPKVGTGTFAVAGLGRDSQGPLAIGAFVGRPVCQEPDTKEQAAKYYTNCQEVSGGCAIAVGALENSSGFAARPYEEAPDIEPIQWGRACETASTLVVDVDSDGILEHFSLADFSSQVPEELPLLPSSSLECDSNFAASVSTFPGNTLVRMAVFDLDADGRLEIVYRYHNEVLLFGAPDSPGRLELLGRQNIPPVPIK